MKYLIFLFHLVTIASSGSLDLLELNTVQYNVEILDTPISDQQTEEDSQSPPRMTMVNKEGQKYSCSLPAIPETVTNDHKLEEESAVDIASLLSPLEDGPCMFKTKDWWTYEVCYKRSVRQYHVENDKPVGDIMVLGVHDVSKDKFDESNTTYLPQWYTNGTKCDLTGKPRQTELRFICNEAAIQDYIGDIFEPQSCEYSIVIHTSRLCSVPWLRPVAEPTPLPIVCQPLLSHHQMEKYKVYLEKKKIADELEAKKKSAEKVNELAKTFGGSHVGDGLGSLDNLLSSMGDNMADNLVSEISNLLDKAMSGESAGGIKVIDLRNKDQKEEEKDEEKKEEKPKLVESKASEGWDLVHHKHTPPSDPELRSLISQRNQIWREIHEAKKMVKKYTSQLHDTLTFLDNERKDVFQNEKVVEKLTIQQKTIEKALSRAREDVAALEIKSKDISHRIVSVQNRIMHQKTHAEKEIWLKRLGQIEAISGAEPNDDTFTLLLDMASDYKKITNEWLTDFDDYFKVAHKIIGDEVPVERFESAKNLIKSFGLMPTKEEVMLHMTDQADDKVAAKFHDVFREDVKDQFEGILKEAAEELEIPGGDVDKDEAMAAMTDTLEEIMKKLAGAGDKIDNVQNSIDQLKKMGGDEELHDDISLKRDNKNSVKKDLSQSLKNDEDDEDQEELDDDEDEEDSLRDKVYNKAVEVLKETETEVSHLEKQIQEIKNRDPGLDNVKVSVKSLGPQLDSDEATENVVKKLEDTIRDKLSKLNLDTGGRPIEVKLITTQIPDNMVEAGNGESDDAQVQGMFYNMMTGNIQGYEDINNQRKIENNYKFTWNENIVDDIEKTINDHGDDGQVDSDELFNANENELDANSFYHGGDQRQRPSSLHSKISDSDSDNSDNDSDDYEVADIKDEL